MRTPLVLAALALASSVALGQEVTDCYNGFGIYLEPSPASPTNYTEYLGPPGIVTAYLVLLNPYNEQLGRPITNLGGYELKLGVPDHLQVAYTLHGDATNYEFEPEFFVGLGVDTGMPVAGNQALLMTLEIEAVTDVPAFLHILEYSFCGPARCDSSLAVVDADDNWSVSQGTPTSYDLDAPVFCMFADCDSAPGGYPPGGTGGVWGDCWVVPAAMRSWGDIKAMYR